MDLTTLLDKLSILPQPMTVSALTENFERIFMMPCREYFPLPRNFEPLFEACRCRAGVTGESHNVVPSWLQNAERDPLLRVPGRWSTLLLRLSSMEKLDVLLLPHGVGIVLR